MSSRKVWTLQVLEHMCLRQKRARPLKTRTWLTLPCMDLTREHVLLRKDRVLLRKDRVLLRKERMDLTRERVLLRKERVLLRKERVLLRKGCVDLMRNCVGSRKERVLLRKERVDLTRERVLLRKERVDLMRERGGLMKLFESEQPTIIDPKLWHRAQEIKATESKFSRIREWLSLTDCCAIRICRPSKHDRSILHGYPEFTNTNGSHTDCSAI